MGRGPACTVAMVALLAVGCGEKRSESPGAKATTTSPKTVPEPTGQVVDRVTVTETEFRLDPQDTRVNAGVVVFTARNAGSTAHALEVEGPKGEVETDEIAPGKSATIKVDLTAPGTYEWYCPVDGHKDRGMRGTLEAVE
jgi:uncharacterized cupredoxin-like copper-binding protein